MGRYTIIEDATADAAVQEVLDRVCKEVSALLGRALQAIVLVGGYGRGEGGIYKVAGEYSLVNDLDLLVFIKNDLKETKKRLGPAIKELSNHLVGSGKGLKDIDIELTNITRYKYLVPKTVGFYEICNGHQVIFGEMNLRKVMPNIDPAKLPQFEGTNYFRNRGSGLLIAALYFLTDALADTAKRKNFQIELFKACQAMGDAFLLMNGQYHFSYRERLDRFKKYGSNKLTDVQSELFKEIAPLYEWGVTNKLTPSFVWPGDKEMIDKWFEIQKTFGNFFLWHEFMRLRQEFATWIDYTQYIAKRGTGAPAYLRVRSLIWLFRSLAAMANRNTLSPLRRIRRCLQVMPLLVFSLARDFTVQHRLVEAAAEVSGQAFSTADLALWKKLVKDYLLTFYPKDIVMNAVSSISRT